MLQQKKSWDKLSPSDLTRTRISFIPENTVIRCDIDLHTLQFRSSQDQHRMDNRRRAMKQLVRPWWKLFAKDPAIKVRDQNIEKYGERQLMQVSTFDGYDNEPTQAKVLVVLKPQWILDPEGFSRRATIVGQLIGVMRKGEELIPCDRDGPWFEFRPKPDTAAGAHQPPGKISTQEETKLTPGSAVSEQDQQRAAAQLPSVLEGSRLPTSTQYPPDAAEGSKGRLRELFHRRRHKEASVDVEPARDVNLEQNGDVGNEERWEASAVLRPIMIFK